MKNVAGKVVLVTGAAMGLGRLFAMRAVEEGAAAVVLWDIDESALQRTADELRTAATAVHPFVVDVSSEAAIADAAARVKEVVGRVDVLINNAGVVRGNAYFWETTNKADITATVAVNTVAPMLITLEFLPEMVTSGSECRVVTIASMAGFLANTRMAAYVGSKWAAVGWSDSVRLDLEQAGHQHVKVTTVCPGYIDTGMFDGVTAHPLIPILTPRAVVDAAWKGMSKGAPFVVMPWMSQVGKAVHNALPTTVRQFVLERLGLYRSMAQFHGRAKSSAA